LTPPRSHIPTTFSLQKRLLSGVLIGVFDMKKVLGLSALILLLPAVAVVKERDDTAEVMVPPSQIVVELL